jgi:hypothetical protein
MAGRHQGRGRPLTRADFAVVALSAALIGWAFSLAGPKHAAGWVEVDVLGKNTGVYPLDRDRDIVVQGRIGRATLRIADGRVRFVDSPCPNKICIHAGWLRYGGEVAVCVPNGVSIRLLGTAKTVDGVT